MIKKLLIALLIMVPALCFADLNLTYIPNTASGVLDLASTDYPTHTTTSAQYYLNKDASDVYYDSQIIGSLEFRRDGESYQEKMSNMQISVQLITGDSNDGWFYTYTKDDVTYKRPFSIILVARNEKLEQGWMGQLGDLYYEAFEDGDYNKAMGDSAGSKTYTKYSTTKYTNTITFENSYPALIWDVVLVFDNDVDRTTNTVEDVSGNSYSLASSGSGYYNALLKITVDYRTRYRTWYGGWSSWTTTSTSYLVDLNGTYNPTTTDSSSASISNIISTLNITRLSTADSLNLLTLLESGTDSKTNIATYSFTAIDTSGNDSRDFSLFLSSSNVGTTAGEGFMFKHINSNGATSSYISNHNAMKFYAYMIPDDSSTAVEFDGTGTYTSSISGNSLVVSPTYDSTYNYTRWSSSGNIAIAIPSSQTINGAEVTKDTLVSGRYCTTIYIHVVSSL